MKAVRVTVQADGTSSIAPLAWPAIQRKGDAGADNFRKAATVGVMPSHFNSQPAYALRAIMLSEGEFKGLASQAGALLTLVVSGDVTLKAGRSQSELEAGDIFLSDEESAPGIVLDVRGQGRLVQLAIASDWPPAGAEIPTSGTINPRQGPPNFTRIVKGEGSDDKAHFAELTELFPKTCDRWSSPFPLTGFRMMCWEDGWMDFHPCVTNQMSIIMSGEMEVEVGGGAKTRFRAGDICVAEDRTGQGHTSRARGAVHTTNLVFAMERVWGQE